MASHATSCWEAPKFNFNFPQQSEDWRVFYTRATDYLEALDIDAKEAEECKRGWKQLKMMFEGKDWQTLQSLIDNVSITLESQRTPELGLDATGTTIKAEEHFGTSGMNSSPASANSLMRVSIPCLCTLVSQYKFSHPGKQEMLKLMVLQHAVWYHEARDLI